MTIVPSGFFRRCVLPSQIIGCPYIAAKPLAVQCHAVNGSTETSYATLKNMGVACQGQNSEETACISAQDSLEVQNL